MDDKLGSIPDRRLSLAAWEQMLWQYPAAWHASLRLALRRAREDPWHADAAFWGTGVIRWSVEQEEK